MAIDSRGPASSEHGLERKEIKEKEILGRLRLYHQTSKEKWEAMQKEGAILSEKELLKKGLISPEQLEDFESTSTGEIDRLEGRDEYVFASHNPQGYGEVTLEIDPSALEINGAKVSTAGDWALFAGNPDDEKYFRESEIPASEFVDYLRNYLCNLPSPEWFWEGDDPEIGKMIGEGMMEKIQGNPEKIRKFWSLHPEILFPKELPLTYVKNVEIHE
ncbi:hypothetical protein KKC60_03910 [Patescibacteria group bacterium]|nr:hypothetical protein [Patescibacteria group bacterium]